MELRLYRQPIINFQGPKSKGTSRGMYVKILFCSNLEKFNFNNSFFTHVIHFSDEPCFSSKFFCPGTTFKLLNFQRTLSNNRLSVLFRPLESSVEDKNFQSTSVFLPSCTQKCHSSTSMQIAKLVLFNEKPS